LARQEKSYFIDGILGGLKSTGGDLRGIRKQAQSYENPSDKIRGRGGHGATFTHGEKITDFQTSRSKKGTQCSPVGEPLDFKNPPNLHLGEHKGPVSLSCRGVAKGILKT